MSDQDPPVSRWVVRKTDGTELRFPSLEALKGYILSGVVTSGDVVAPEDASWARVEDLAELASLLGMIAPPSQEAGAVKRPATRPNLNFGRALDKPNTEGPPDDDMTLVDAPLEAPAPGPKTVPPPLPAEETEAVIELDDLDEPSTIYSGPPSFTHDPPSRDLHLEPPLEPDPLSRPLNTPSASDAQDSPLSRPLRAADQDEEALLSRPIGDLMNETDPLSRPLMASSPQTHEVMTLQLRRAQRRRIIIGSIVAGMLIAVAAFFAFQSIQKASMPPDEAPSNQAAEEKAEEPEVKTPEAKDEGKAPEPEEAEATQKKAEAPDENKAEAPAEDKAEVPAEDKAKAPAEDKAEAPAEDKAEVPAEDKAEAPTAKKSGEPVEKKASPKPSEDAPEPKAADPVNVDGMMGRAKRLRKKDPAEALRLYKKVLAKKPGYADAMQLAARANLQLGRKADAVKLLKACRTNQPNFTPCIYYLGVAYDRMGRKADAKKAYKSLIDQFPGASLADKARQKLAR